MSFSVFCHRHNPVASVLCKKSRRSMRAKSLVLLLTCFAVTTFCLFFFGDKQPAIHTIVSQTHKQLNNLKNLKENLKATERKELMTDPKYLSALGFVSKPRLFPEDVWRNVSLPVVATAVLSQSVETIMAFLQSVRRFLPESWVVIFDLGLLESARVQIVKHCNCTVRPFDFDLFPPHVADVSISSYRPIAIQDILDKAGAVFWLDVEYRLKTSQLDPAFKRAAEAGVATWGDKIPTSSLTHPHMFDYFRTQQHNFFFHHMADPAHVVLYNTPKVHGELMLPWLQCALTPECVAPIGAQRSGCRFDKKPLYRYSGCHRYDASAFSVALGVMFGWDDEAYTMAEEPFVVVMSTDVQGQDNSTVNSWPKDESSR